jgi:LysR family nitrogen assimilation transcriptional regulator
MPSSLELRELRCFASVAECGSLSRACDHLHVTQPALSRTIRSLEDKLGVALFDRNGRGLVLTEAGKRLLDRSTDVFRLVEDTEAEVGTFSHLATGTVVLGIPPSFFGLAPGLLNRCRELHPSVNIRLLEGFNGYLQEWLLAGTVDLAILNSRASDLGRFKTTHLATDRLYLIGRTEGSSPVQATVAREVAFENLPKWPVILPTRTSALRKIIEEAALDANVAINPIHELDSIAAIKEVIFRGEGVAILPLASVARELRAGQIWAARLAKPEIQRELVLASSLSRVNSKAVRAVHDVIVNDLRSIISASNLDLGFTA